MQPRVGPQPSRGRLDHGPWTHLSMVQAPFADFTWRFARQLVAGRGGKDTSQTMVAQVLAELVHRAEAGPPADRRVASRTRTTAAMARQRALRSSCSD